MKVTHVKTRHKGLHLCELRWAGGGGIKKKKEERKIALIMSLRGVWCATSDLKGKKGNQQLNVWRSPCVSKYATGGSHSGFAYQKGHLSDVKKISDYKAVWKMWATETRSASKKKKNKKKET